MHVIHLYVYVLLTHCRMAGLDKEDKKHSLFRDEKELLVAIKYMIENGEYLAVEFLINAFEEMYNETCMCNTDIRLSMCPNFLKITINALIEDSAALIETQLFP